MRDWKVGEKVVVYAEGVIKSISQSDAGIELTIRYPNPDKKPFAFDKGCAVVSEELVTRADEAEGAA